MKTTFVSDDGQHFFSEEECREYERLLPMLSEAIVTTDEIELGAGPESLLKDLSVIHKTSLERYLFNNRNVIAKLAAIFTPVATRR